MDKSTQKMLLIVGVLVGAAVGAYFLFFKKKGSLSSEPSVNSADDAAYNRMYSYLSTKVDKPAVDGWISESARKYYEGARNIHPDYLINGQVTKTGSLLAAWSSDVFGNHDTKVNGDRNQVNEEMYNIFYALRGSHNKL